jgi:hypothetical protein
LIVDSTVVDSLEKIVARQAVLLSKVPATKIVYRDRPTYVPTTEPIVVKPSPDDSTSLVETKAFLATADSVLPNGDTAHIEFLFPEMQFALQYKFSSDTLRIPYRTVYQTREIEVPPSLVSQAGTHGLAFLVGAAVGVILGATR